MRFVYDDGGRAVAGYKGSAGDCVCRAIAVAAELPYSKVYEDLNELGNKEYKTKLRKTKSSARSGVHKATIHKYLKQLGWQYVACMGIGTGCKVHLCDGELPNGRLIVQVSKHLTAVIDNIIHDTHDPSREGTRCVYGYWTKS